MLEGKAVVMDTDMSLEMQAQAMAFASQALDLYEVFDCTSIAAYIKKVKCLYYLIFPSLFFLTLFISFLFSP